MPSQILQLSGRLRGSAFLGNTSRLLSGEVLAQITGLAALPFLTRLYGPEAFGLLGIFMAISEVGGKCTSLRYDVALVLPQRDSSAWALYSFSVIWAWAFVLFGLAVLYPFRWEISAYFGLEAMAPYFVLIALMMLAIGLQSLASFWSMRLKHFKALAEASAGSALLGSAFKLLVGLMGFSAGGLLLGTALQRWCNLWILRMRTPRSIWRHSYARGEPRQLAVQYKDFPLYRLPQDILNVFGRMMPNLFLVIFFGAAAAGFYIMADRILRLPLGLLQEALRKVFYVKAVEAADSSARLMSLSLKLSGLIALGLLPVVLVVLLWGPALCALVFGGEWSVTGEYARWIILAVFFRFTSLPAAVLIPVMGWNRFYLIFEFLSTLMRLAVIVWVARAYTPATTVMAIALSSAAGSLVLLGVVLFRLFKRLPAAGPHHIN